MSLTNLKELEKKAFRSFHQDGLWDIFLGLMLAQMGIANFLGKLHISETLILLTLLVFAALVVALFYFAKKKLTTPRLGYVKFGEERKKRLHKVRLVLAAGVLVGLLFFFVPLLRNIAPGLFSGSTKLPLFLLAWSVQSVIIFSVMAYFMDFTRLYFYAWIFAGALPLGFVLEDVLGNPFGMAIATSFLGVVMLVIGVVFLLRFLRAYPVREDAK